MHFVFPLTTGSSSEILKSIKYTFRYVKRRYRLNCAVLQIDGEMSLLESNEYSDFRDEEGFEERISAPYAHQQHGRAERSGGVLSNRATKLRISANLHKALEMDIWRRWLFTQSISHQTTRMEVTTCLH